MFVVRWWVVGECCEGAWVEVVRGADEKCGLEMGVGAGA